MERQDITLVSLWVHVPFITTWIGLVMLDAFAAFAPGVDKSQRLRILEWSRPFTLLAIPVIMITGIWQTMDNPFVQVESYSDLSTLRGRTLYGDLLFWKHVFVVATFGLTLLSRFYFATRARGQALTMEATTNGPTAVATPVREGSAFRLLQVMVLLNLAACFGALMLATRMVMELH